MNIDIKSMSQGEKNSFYTAVAMLVTFVLPWWSISTTANVSGLGQDFSTSGSISHNGFQMYGFIIGLAGAGGAAYFIAQKNKLSLWCAVVGVLYAANTYFGLVGNEKTNFNVNAGEFGNISASSGY